ncbi:MAG: DUF4058 family protein [Gemmataceae bacterium]
MPSPFPGMNPYLEQEDVWQDFHEAIIPALRDALSPQVSPHYIVKIEEHLYIHEPPANKRFLVGHADVSVASNPHSEPGASARVAIAAPPTRVLLPSVEIESESYLEIRDRISRELVTVIELLSPTNKRPGSDREQYLAKRANLLRSAAHLVEIDLLRGWPRMPLEKRADCDYYVLVSRVDERPEAGFWPLKIRDPLPNVPVPLRGSSPDVLLPLQETLHAVYDRAYYKDYIYQGTPNPPLSEADSAWARSVIDDASR